MSKGINREDCPKEGIWVSQDREGHKGHSGREDGWVEMHYQVDKSREAQASISEFCDVQVGRNNTEEDI